MAYPLGHTESAGGSGEGGRTRGGPERASCSLQCVRAVLILGTGNP